jgi:hypothetical protein
MQQGIAPGLPSQTPTVTAIQTAPTSRPDEVSIDANADPRLALSELARQEYERLEQTSFIALEELSIGMAQPLPASAEAAAKELGTPMVSVIFRNTALPTGQLSPKLFLVFCAVFLGVAMAGSTVGYFLALVLGIPLVAAGIWVDQQRIRFPPGVAWICPRGLIWQRGSRVRSWRWKEIDDCYVTAYGGWPYFRLRLGDEMLDIVTRGAARPIRLGEFIEARVSANRLPHVLEQLAHGERIWFGSLEMDRGGLRWRYAATTWREVSSVLMDNTWVYIDLTEHVGWLRLPRRYVSFPSLALAVARIMIGERSLQ